MMRGKTVIVGDVGEIERRYEKGEITLKEKDELFTKSRQKGATGDIFPFAVGGSDIAKLLGVSKHGTPEYTVLNKLDPEKYPDPKMADSQENLDNGHIFESAIAQKCALILGNARGKKVRYEPCTLQFKNTAWPNIVANIDGFYNVDGKRYLLEVKTAALGGDAWKSFKDNKIPEDYQLQAATYCKILNMDGAFFAVWNKESLDEKNFRVIWFPCPDDHDKVMDKVQKIVDDAAKGIIPDDRKIAVNQKGRRTTQEKIFSRLDPDLKPVQVSDEMKPVLEKIEELFNQKEEQEKKVAEVERTFLDEKNKAERERKAAGKDERKVLQEIEEQIADICASNILPVMQNGSTLVYQDGSDTLEIDLERKLSFTKNEKNFLKENYPEAWEALNAFNPKFEYSFKRVQG